VRLDQRPRAARPCRGAGGDNIDHVTITINMVDPMIGEKIYPWIFFQEPPLHRREASQILHEQQMKGLEMLDRSAASW
jgi:MoaA/NifB/PqqE/SkfB family radical SAM enzyme